MTELDWKHPTVEIPEKGLPVHRVATPEEQAVLTAALDILSLDALDVRYRIRAVPGGAFRLDGRFEARVTQACVVSLEPVADRIIGEFDVEFRPEVRPEARREQRPGGGDRAASKEGEQDVTVDPFAKVEVEAIENGIIDAGRVVFEEIASLLNPYPRAAGSQFDWQDPKLATTDNEPRPDSPFAKLALLRGKKPPQ